jgi:hypothetical protein
MLIDFQRATRVMSMNFWFNKFDIFHDRLSNRGLICTTELATVFIFSYHPLTDTKVVKHRAVMKTVCAQVAVSNLILVRPRVKAKWKYASKSKSNNMASASC